MATETPKKTAWVIDQAHTGIEVAVRHMMISTVKGRFPKFEVDVDFDETKPENSRVEARIDAASVDTKEPKRDAHLRSSDFLDAEKFPWITFKSKHIKARGGNRYDVVGNLSIRGVTREVVLDATLEGIAKDPMGNVHAGFTAATAINRKDYGLVWNMALETGGLLVGDTVKINIEAEFIKQA